MVRRIAGHIKDGEIERMNEENSKVPRRYETHNFENAQRLQALAMGMDTARLEKVSIMGREEPRFLAVVNNATGDVESLVSDKYTLIQHREIFQPVIDAFIALGIKISGKVTYDKGRCYADIIFDDERFKVDVADRSKMKKGDVINFGMRFFNSYDKTLSFGAEAYAVRLVCLNGMVSPVNIKAIREVHAGDKSFVAKSIGQIVKALAAESPKFADVVARTRQEIVTEAMIRELFTAWKMGAKHVEALMKQVKKLDEKNGWEIYNVLTAYITRSLEVREASKERWHKQYANKILAEPISQLIVKAKAKGESRC